MVGERVTLADISLVCNMLLLFVQVGGGCGKLRVGGAIS